MLIQQSLEEFCGFIGTPIGLINSAHPVACSVLSFLLNKLIELNVKVEKEIQAAR
jgi:hypothetical protein